MNIFQLKVRSRLAHAIGALLFGSPEQLKVAPDFYYLPTDRELPAPGEDTLKTQMGRVYTNRIRLAITRRAYVLAGVVSTTLIVSAAVLSGVPSPAKMLDSSLQFIRAVPVVGSMVPVGEREAAAKRAAQVIANYKLSMSDADMCMVITSELKFGSDDTPAYRQALAARANAVSHCGIKE